MLRAQGAAAVVPAEAAAPQRPATRPGARGGSRPAILHVITDLGMGGAEAMLYKLVLTSRARRHVRHAVVSLMDDGAYGPKLRAEGIPVASLGMRQGVPNPSVLPRLHGVLRRERPDVVHAWMYHADLVAGLVAWFPRVPVIWAIHHAAVDGVKPLTRFTRALCGLLSGAMPARIVCCAESARRAHAELGYRAERMTVIPNGFDVDRFAPSAKARSEVRAELDIAPGAPVVGWVARFHPDKDYANFLSAAARVARERPDVSFLAMGEGLVGSNAELRTCIATAGLDASRLRLLGTRPDAHRVFTAMDVLASSSRGEAFPQVLGEAMLCGVPCAATDCGDCREIVGPTGRIVPTHDAGALAGAILELLAVEPHERAALSTAARERIASRYDMRLVADRYCDLYAELVRRDPHGGVRVR